MSILSRHSTDHFQALDRAMAPVDHLVCFAVKSNSNQSVLRTLANLGSGFDIVSGGELQRVIAAGGDPGVRLCGRGQDARTEIEFALRQGVYTFNAESEPELERINRVAARLKKVAPVAVRVNPNVERKTHKKITTGTYENKFGIAFEQIEGVYARARKLKNLRLRGLQMHIGSQITEVAPFEQAVTQSAAAGARAQRPAIWHRVLQHRWRVGHRLRSRPGERRSRLVETAGSKGHSNAAKIRGAPAAAARPLGLRILMEPGRFISGNAGVLITRVEYVKRTGQKNFLIVDARDERPDPPGVLRRLS